jgi:Arc/MetJ-type ribon-helix-helix transcriptional regulator
MVQLTDDLVVALDRHAARYGKSRSAVIREALEDFLASTREAEIEAQPVAGYSQVPQGAGDEWGTLAEEGRRNTERTLRRLDEEEEAAGLSW